MARRRNRRVREEMPQPRIPLVDAWRGTALLFMVAYHFCFDLNYFGFARFDFQRDIVWLTLRALILSQFLLVVGVSLHLATARGLDINRHARRLLVLVLSAGAVSAASYLVFPASGIFFGVLHFIAVASLLGLLFVRFHTLNAVLGIAWILFGLLYRDAWFDQPWANWVGLMTRKPFTEDYVPLFPWFGVVLLGLFLGKSVAGRGWPAAWRPRGWWGRMLTRAGRHSLAIYMLHQPVLLGVLYLAKLV